MHVSLRVCRSGNDPDMFKASGANSRVNWLTKGSCYKPEITFFSEQVAFEKRKKKEADAAAAVATAAGEFSAAVGLAKLFQQLQFAWTS